MVRSECLSVPVLVSRHEFPLTRMTSTVLGGLIGAAAGSGYMPQLSPSPSRPTSSTLSPPTRATQAWVLSSHRMQYMVSLV